MTELLEAAADFLGGGGARGGVFGEEGDVTWHHRHTPPPDPRAKGADVPEYLAALILSLLAKDPAARPASADDVGRRLQALV